VLRKFLTSLIFVSSASIALHAQAVVVAERSGGIQVGGGLTIIRPDYNAGTIIGLGVYGNYDFTPHIGIEGDIHIGSLRTPGLMSESTYLFGPRFGINRRRFHPYAKALLGLGVFSFQEVNGQPSRSSTNKVYAFGGGLDVALKRHLNVRAFDMEYQRWPGFSTNGLTPIVFTVGAAYSF
jgi:opacity protein-like surface antigen